MGIDEPEMIKMLMIFKEKKNVFWMSGMKDVGRSDSVEGSQSSVTCPLSQGKKGGKIGAFSG